MNSTLYEKIKVAKKVTKELKTVFLLFAKANEDGSIIDITEKARTDWENELENLSTLQAKLIKELYSNNSKQKERVQDLEIENQQLDQDKKRLQKQLKESLGVSPKSINTQKNSSKGDNKKDTKKKRGAPKGHKGKSRLLPDSWNSTEIIPAVSTCSCGHTVEPIDEYDHKYIEDIPEISKITIKKSYQLGRCSKCQKIHRHKEGYNGPPVEIGPNLSAHLVMMRQMGCTYRKMSQFCKDTLGIDITPSGILGIVSRATEKLKPTYNEIGSMLRVQNVVHGDETGWKVGKENWYIWCFCNAHMAYFKSSKTRASSVPIDILGKNFNGTLVCDFYGAYNFASKIQRCLIHYTRNIREEREIFPGHKGLEVFEDRIWKIIEEGQEIQLIESDDERQQKSDALEKKLENTLKLNLPNGKPQTLQSRIQKFKGELLTFTQNPEIEYHNNRAERQVRPMVITRKMSYGSDSSNGADSTCILHSVVETCRLNDHKPIEYLKGILTGVNGRKVFTDEVMQKPLS